MSHVYIQGWAFQLEGTASTKTLSWIHAWSVWTELRRPVGMDQNEGEGGVQQDMWKLTKVMFEWTAHLGNYIWAGIFWKWCSNPIEWPPKWEFWSLGKRCSWPSSTDGWSLLYKEPSECPGPGRKKEVFGQKTPKLLFHLVEATPVTEFPSSTPPPPTPLVLLWLAGGLGFPSSLCKADTHQYYSKWVDSK